MKALALATAFGLTLSATTTAGTFSVSGLGGALPDNVAGSVYPGTMPTGNFSSTVLLAYPVTGITSLTITGISHTWIGDLSVVVRDPSGVGHNVFVRPGYLNTSNFGNSGDFLGGTFVFVDPGTAGASLLPVSSTTATNPTAGTYQQAFGMGAGVWPSGTAGIDNAPLSTITGPAGTWTLSIYDWAAGDTGNITGWTLAGNDSYTPSGAFCAGDQLDPLVTTPCPCGNFGTLGNGCANSVNSAGAKLTATGTPNPDTMVLLGSGMPATVSCIYLQGDALDDTTFGDGVRCAGGTLIRLKAKANVGGASQFPETAAGDPLLSVRGAVTPGSSAVRYYQTYYRNSAPGFCPPETFNVSNGWKLVW